MFNNNMQMLAQKRALKEIPEDDDMDLGFNSQIKQQNTFDDGNIFTELNLMDQSKNVSGAKQNMMDQSKHISGAKQNIMDQSKNVSGAKQNLLDQSKHVSEAKQNILDQSKNVSEAKQNIMDRSKNVSEAKQNMMDESKHISGAKQNILDQSKNVSGAKQNILDQHQHGYDDNQHIDDDPNHICNTLLWGKSQDFSPTRKNGVMYKGKSKEEAVENYKVKNEEEIGFFYLQSIPLWAQEQQIRDSIKEKFDLLENLKKICEKDPAKETSYKKYGSNIDMLELKMSLAVYTALNPEAREKYFKLLRLRCYASQSITLVDIENRFNNRTFMWQIFKIFLNYNEINIIEFDLIKGYFMLFSQLDKTTTKVAREDFIGFIKTFEDNTFELIYLDSKGIERVIQVNCVHELQHDQLFEVFNLFEIFDDFFVNPTKFSKNGLWVGYTVFEEHIGIYPIIDDRITPKGTYMMLEAESSKRKTKVFLGVGGSAIIESSDENFSNITDVFIFYGSNPELNFLHNNVAIKDKEEEINYKFNSAKRASEFYYQCLDIKKNLDKSCKPTIQQLAPLVKEGENYLTDPLYGLMLKKKSECLVTENRFKFQVSNLDF